MEGTVPDYAQRDAANVETLTGNRQMKHMSIESAINRLDSTIGFIAELLEEVEALDTISEYIAELEREVKCRE